MMPVFLGRKNMKAPKTVIWLAAPSLFAIATAAHAQSTSTDSASISKPTAASADTASDGQSGDTSQDIVVTARLQSERAIDVPGTVTGVSSRNLAERNVLKFDDLDSIVPGLNIAPGGIGSDAKVAVRGVQFNAPAQAANTVSAYINDVPTNLFKGG